MIVKYFVPKPEVISLGLRLLCLYFEDNLLYGNFPLLRFLKFSIDKPNLKLLSKFFRVEVYFYLLYTLHLSFFVEGNVKYLNYNPRYTKAELLFVFYFLRYCPFAP